MADGHPGGTGLSPHTTLHRQSCQPGTAHPPVCFSMLPMLWQERDPQLPISRLNCWEFKAGVRKGCFVTRLVQLDISYLQHLLKRGLSYATVKLPVCMHGGFCSSPVFNHTVVKCFLQEAMLLCVPPPLSGKYRWCLRLWRGSL